MEPTKDIEFVTLSGKLPKNWEKPRVPDEIIDAYEAGKSEQARINLQALSDNLQRACDAAEQLYDALMGPIGLPCSNLHMRINGLSRFQALFLVDLDAYINDSNRNGAYLMAQELSKTSRTATFHIEFTFMPASNHVNADAIASDGYFLTYHPNQGKNTTVAAK